MQFLAKCETFKSERLLTKAISNIIRQSIRCVFNFRIFALPLFLFLCFTPFFQADSQKILLLISFQIISKQTPQKFGRCNHSPFESFCFPPQLCGLEYLRLNPSEPPGYAYEKIKGLYQVLFLISVAYSVRTSQTPIWWLLGPTLGVGHVVALGCAGARI